MPSELAPGFYASGSAWRECFAPVALQVSRRGLDPAANLRLAVHAVLHQQQGAPLVGARPDHQNDKGALPLEVRLGLRLCPETGPWERNRLESENLVRREFGVRIFEHRLVAGRLGCCLWGRYRLGDWLVDRGETRRSRSRRRDRRGRLRHGLSRDRESVGTHSLGHRSTWRRRHRSGRPSDLSRRWSRRGRLRRCARTAQIIPNSALNKLAHRDLIGFAIRLKALVRATADTDASTGLLLRHI